MTLGPLEVESAEDFFLATSLRHRWVEGPLLRPALLPGLNRKLRRGMQIRSKTGGQVTPHAFRCCRPGSTGRSMSSASMRARRQQADLESSITASNV